MLLERQIFVDTFSRSIESISEINIFKVYTGWFHVVSPFPPALLSPPVVGSNFGHEQVVENRVVAEHLGILDDSEVEVSDLASICEVSNKEEDVEHEEVDEGEDSGDNSGPEHALLEEAVWNEREEPNCEKEAVPGSVSTDHVAPAVLGERVEVVESLNIKDAGDARHLFQ